MQNQMELFENAEEEKIKNINRAHKAALLNSVSSNQALNVALLRLCHIVDDITVA